MGQETTGSCGCGGSAQVEQYFPGVTEQTEIYLFSFWQEQTLDASGVLDDNQMPHLSITLLWTLGWISLSCTCTILNSENKKTDLLSNNFSICQAHKIRKYRCFICITARAPGSSSINFSHDKPLVAVTHFKRSIFTQFKQIHISEDITGP